MTRVRRGARAHAAVAFACPWCEAPAGHPCASRSSGALMSKTQVHGARADLLRAAHDTEEHGYLPSRPKAPIQKPRVP